MFTDTKALVGFVTGNSWIAYADFKISLIGISKVIQHFASLRQL